jgi:hypothetical protein
MMRRRRAWRSPESSQCGSKAFYLYKKINERPKQIRIGEKTARNHQSKNNPRMAAKLNNERDRGQTDTR